MDGGAAHADVVLPRLPEAGAEDLGPCTVEFVREDDGEDHIALEYYFEDVPGSGNVATSSSSSSLATFISTQTINQNQTLTNQSHNQDNSEDQNQEIIVNSAAHLPGAASSAPIVMAPSGRAGLARNSASRSRSSTPLLPGAISDEEDGHDEERSIASGSEDDDDFNGLLAEAAQKPTTMTVRNGQTVRLHITASSRFSATSQNVATAKAETQKGADGSVRASTTGEKSDVSPIERHLSEKSIRASDSGEHDGSGSSRNAFVTVRGRIVVHRKSSSSFSSSSSLSSLDRVNSKGRDDANEKDRQSMCTDDDTIADAEGNDDERVKCDRNGDDNDGEDGRDDDDDDDDDINSEEEDVEEVALIIMVCKSVLECDVSQLAFYDCIPNKSYWKEFTIWNRSEIPLQFRCISVNADAIALQVQEDTKLFDAGRRLSVPGYSHRRLRVTYRPAGEGAFKYTICIENINNLSNSERVLVHTNTHAPGRAMESGGALLVRDAKANTEIRSINFNDCLLGVKVERMVRIKNTTDRELDIPLTSSSPFVSFTFDQDKRVKEDLDAPPRASTANNSMKEVGNAGNINSTILSNKDELMRSLNADLLSYVSSEVAKPPDVDGVDAMTNQDDDASEKSYQVGHQVDLQYIEAGSESVAGSENRSRATSPVPMGGWGDNGPEDEENAFRVRRFSSQSMPVLTTDRERSRSPPSTVEQQQHQVEKKTVRPTPLISKQSMETPSILSRERSVDGNSDNFGSAIEPGSNTASSRNLRVRKDSFDSAATNSDDDRDEDEDEDDEDEDDEDDDEDDDSDLNRKSGSSNSRKHRGRGGRGKESQASHMGKLARRGSADSTASSHKGSDLKESHGSKRAMQKASDATLSLGPGMEKVVIIKYRPGVLDQDEETSTSKLAYKLRRRDFLIHFSSLTIHASARVCKNGIALAAPELNFGDCNVGVLKTKTVRIFNLSDLKTNVKVLLRSKVVTLYVENVEEPLVGGALVENSFELEPHAVKTITVWFMARKVNLNYHKLIQFKSVQSNVTLTVRSSNMDSHNIIYHSLFYRLLPLAKDYPREVLQGQKHKTPPRNHLSEIDFGELVFRSPGLRSFQVRNIANKPITLRFTTSRAHLRCYLLEERPSDAKRVDSAKGTGEGAGLVAGSSLDPITPAKTHRKAESLEDAPTTRHILSDSFDDTFVPTPGGASERKSSTDYQSGMTPTQTLKSSITANEDPVVRLRHHSMTNMSTESSGDVYSAKDAEPSSNHPVESDKMSAMASALENIHLTHSWSGTPGPCKSDEDNDNNLDSAGLDGDTESLHEQEDDDDVPSSSLGRRRLSGHISDEVSELHSVYRGTRKTSDDESADDVAREQANVRRSRSLTNLLEKDDDEDSDLPQAPRRGGGGTDKSKKGKKQNAHENTPSAHSFEFWTPDHDKRGSDLEDSAVGSGVSLNTNGPGENTSKSQRRSEIPDWNAICDAFERPQKLFFSGMEPSEEHAVVNQAEERIKALKQALQNLTPLGNLVIPAGQSIRIGVVIYPPPRKSSDQSSESALDEDDASAAAVVRDQDTHFTGKLRSVTEHIFVEQLDLDESDMERIRQIHTWGRVTHDEVRLEKRALPVVAKVGKAIMTFAQRQINFGLVKFPYYPAIRTLYLSNESALPLVYKFRKSRSFNAGFLELIRNSMGMVRPFSTKEIQFRFMPTMAGPIDETLTVYNVLDEAGSLAIKIKATVVRPQRFQVDTAQLFFECIKRSSSVQSLVIRNAYHKHREFAIKLKGSSLEPFRLRFASIASSTRIPPQLGEQIEHLQHKYRIAETKNQVKKLKSLRAKLDELYEKGNKQQADHMRLLALPTGGAKLAIPPEATASVQLQAFVSTERSGQLRPGDYHGILQIFQVKNQDAVLEVPIVIRNSIISPSMSRYDTPPLIPASLAVDVEATDDTAQRRTKFEFARQHRKVELLIGKTTNEISSSTVPRPLSTTITEPKKSSDEAPLSKSMHQHSSSQGSKVSDLVAKPPPFSPVRKSSSISPSPVSTSGGGTAYPPPMHPESLRRSPTSRRKAPKSGRQFISPVRPMMKPRDPVVPERIDKALSSSIGSSSSSASSSNSQASPSNFDFDVTPKVFNFGAITRKTSTLMARFEVRLKSKPDHKTSSPFEFQVYNSSVPAAEEGHLTQHSLLNGEDTLPLEIPVRVSRGGKGGRYSRTIKVQCQGKLKTVIVKYNIMHVHFLNLDPELTGRPATLDFGFCYIKTAHPIPPQKVWIKNIFDQPLAISAESPYKRQIRIFMDLEKTIPMEEILVQPDQDIICWVFIEPDLVGETSRVFRGGVQFLTKGSFTCTVKVKATIGISEWALDCSYLDMGILHSPTDVLRGTFSVKNQTKGMPLRYRLERKDKDSDNDTLAIDFPSSAEDIALGIDSSKLSEEREVAAEAEDRVTIAVKLTKLLTELRGIFVSSVRVINVVNDESAELRVFALVPPPVDLGLSALVSFDACFLGVSFTDNDGKVERPGSSTYSFVNSLASRSIDLRIRIFNSDSVEFPSPLELLDSGPDGTIVRTLEAGGQEDVQVQVRPKTDLRGVESVSGLMLFYVNENLVRATRIEGAVQNYALQLAQDSVDIGKVFVNMVHRVTVEVQNAVPELELDLRVDNFSPCGLAKAWYDSSEHLINIDLEIGNGTDAVLPVDALLVVTNLLNPVDQRTVKISGRIVSRVVEMPTQLTLPTLVIPAPNPSDPLECSSWFTIRNVFGEPLVCTVESEYEPAWARFIKMTAILRVSNEPVQEIRLDSDESIDVRVVLEPRSGARLPRGSFQDVVFGKLHIQANDLKHSIELSASFKPGKTFTLSTSKLMFYSTRREPKVIELVKASENQGFHVRNLSMRTTLRFRVQADALNMARGVKILARQPGTNNAIACSRVQPTAIGTDPTFSVEPSKSIFVKIELWAITSPTATEETDAYAEDDLTSTPSNEDSLLREGNESSVRGILRVLDVDSPGTEEQILVNIRPGSISTSEGASSSNAAVLQSANSSNNLRNLDEHGGVQVQSLQNARECSEAEAGNIAPSLTNAETLGATSVNESLSAGADLVSWRKSMLSDISSEISSHPFERPATPNMAQLVLTHSLTKRGGSDRGDLLPFAASSKTSTSSGSGGTPPLTRDSSFSHDGDVISHGESVARAMGASAKPPSEPNISRSASPAVASVGHETSQDDHSEDGDPSTLPDISGNRMLRPAATSFESTSSVESSSSSVQVGKSVSWEEQLIAKASLFSQVFSTLEMNGTSEHSIALHGCTPLGRSGNRFEINVGRLTCGTGSSEWSIDIQNVSRGPVEYDIILLEEKDRSWLSLSRATGFLNTEHDFHTVNLRFSTDTFGSFSTYLLLLENKYENVKVIRIVMDVVAAAFSDVVAAQLSTSEPAAPRSLFCVTACGDDYFGTESPGVIDLGDIVQGLCMRTHSFILKNLSTMPLMLLLSHDAQDPRFVEFCLDPTGLAVINSVSLPPGGQQRLFMLVSPSKTTPSGSLSTHVKISCESVKDLEVALELRAQCLVPALQVGPLKWEHVEDESEATKLAMLGEERQQLRFVYFGNEQLHDTAHVVLRNSSQKSITARLTSASPFFLVSVPDADKFASPVDSITLQPEESIPIRIHPNVEKLKQAVADEQGKDYGSRDAQSSVSVIGHLFVANQDRERVHFVLHYEEQIGTLGSPRNDTWAIVTTVDQLRLEAQVARAIDRVYNYRFSKSTKPLMDAILHDISVLTDIFISFAYRRLRGGNVHQIAALLFHVCLSVTDGIKPSAIRNVRRLLSCIPGREPAFSSLSSYLQNDV